MRPKINPIAGAMYIWKFAREQAPVLGKSPSWIYKDLIRAKKRNHISLDEYLWTGYAHMSEAQKKTVSTLWTRAEFRKRFTDRRYKGMLINKYYFSKVFSDFYGRRCLPAEQINEDNISLFAENTGKIVYKPSCKGQGQGVRVFPAATEEEKSAALAFLESHKNGIVESYIQQHHEIAELNPNAVSIIRFYSITTAEQSMLFAPVLTVACEKAIANGCQDALTAMIDIRTGIVITDAVDQNSSTDYAVHPITGKAFKGFHVPYWQETLEMMKKALPLARKISNIGWDIAITESGPVIIEANTIPGFNTAQYRGFAPVTDGYSYQPLFDSAADNTPLEHAEHYEKVLMRF